MGLIGFGFIGQTHASSIQTNPEGELVAVCASEGERDLVPDGVDFFPDYKTLLAQDLDGIVIATPTPLHEEMAVAAAEQGKHVFLEKPMAPSLAACNKIVSTASKAGTRLFVGHVLHFWPSYTTARQRVLLGEIGTPKFLRAQRISSFPSWGAWYKQEAESGGVILDLNIHDIDYAMWLFEGVPVEVYCESRAIDVEGGRVPGICFTTLHFDGGAIAYCEASWAARNRYPFTTRCEIGGTGGFIQFESTGTQPVVACSDEDETRWDPYQRDGYWQEMDHFIHVLQTPEEEVAVSGEYSRDVIQACLAARMSARERRPVKITEVEV